MSVVICLIVLGTALLGLADGCSRQAQEYVTPTPNSQLQPPGTGGGSSNKMLNCTPLEYNTAQCLNGNCFVVELQMQRRPFCSCEEGYTGPRCGRLKLDYGASRDQDKIMTASVVAAVAVAVLVAFVAIISIIVFMRWRRKRNQHTNVSITDDAESAPMQNGTTEKVEMDNISDTKPEKNSAEVNLINDSNSSTRET